MQVIHDLEHFTVPGPSAVAIGKFDGVHLGHRRLLQELMRQKEDGLLATVFTFSPLPEVFFHPEGGASVLMTDREKELCLERLGVDLLVEFPFNRESAAMAPETFITHCLVGQLNTKFIAAGADLSFGDRGMGNFALLSSLASHLDYETKMIDKVWCDGKVISSTWIRTLVSEGKMEEAARCLGEPYTVRGKIVHGKALGRRIGIPTLNQLPAPEKLLPPHGVYYSRVRAGGKTYRGMTNIGVRPTVSDGSRLSVETYLYDFTGDLYGEEAEVSLLTFRRPEMRFESVEQLREMMSRDIEAGMNFHRIWS